MKQHTRLTAALAILLVIAASLAMFSCTSRLLAPAETNGETTTEETTTEDDLRNTPTVTTDGSDSTESHSQNSNHNNTTIIVEGESTAYATAMGLRSAVSIYCTFETTSSGGSYWNPHPSTESYYTTGSGVIYSIEEDGSAFVITNYHVVYDASSDTHNGISDKIYLYLYGRESEEYAIDATYVGGSANYDLAVLRVEKSEILKDAYASGSAAAVTVGDSDSLVPGDATVAIGNPSATDLGGISATKGIVSVDSEYITMTASDYSTEVSFRVIRTDTPVNSGNSGGGLYNTKGELVGIVNAKITSSDIESIGYALPSTVVKGIADNIIDHCYGTDCENVMRVILGITVETSSLSTSYDEETGLLHRLEEIRVYEVTQGGIGEKILDAEDVILSITIDGVTKEITRQHHVIDMMLFARVGSEISFKILRGDEELTVSTTVTEDALTAY